MKQSEYPSIFRCDTLAFLLTALFFAYTSPNVMSAFLLLCALLYLVLAVLAVALRHKQQSTSFVPTLHTAIIAVAVGTFVILPTVLFIVRRAQSTPASFAQDSLIQTEAAARFVLAGQNPYVENYLETPLANWEFSWAGLKINPALHHFAYMPLAFLLAVPGEGLRPLINWYDHRAVLLLSYVVNLILLGKIANSRCEANALRILVGLNPLLITAYIYGNLEAPVLTGWLCAYLLAFRKHWAPAFLSLSLAIAVKQIAGVATPFLFIHWLATERPRTSKAILGPIAAFLTPLGVFVIPFLLWNPRAFVEDTVLFLIGGLPDSWPVSGMSLQAMAGSSATTTVSAIGWLASVTVLALTGYLTWRLRSLKAALALQAVFFAVTLFSGRFVNVQYVGYLFVQLALSLWIREPPTQV